MITSTNYRGYLICPTDNGRAIIWHSGESITTEESFEKACEVIDLWVENSKDS